VTIQDSPRKSKTR